MKEEQWKQICDIAEVPMKVRIAIEKTYDIQLRLAAEQKIIDNYIKNVVKEIGYIPDSCSDKNIIYEACLGCGLCRGTNPVQEF